MVSWNNDNGSMKKWYDFKGEYNLHESSYFKRLQLIDSTPERRKIIMKENYENATYLLFMTISSSKAQEL